VLAQSEHHRPSSRRATTEPSGWPAITSPTTSGRTSALTSSPPPRAPEKFRLVRLFREHTGLPPHALQIAHRVRAARRLLEVGETIANTAAATGFSDQSHLHRHFQRSLGVTPGEYQKRIAGNLRYAG
jgi:hypothetical protein